ncbi:XRE family transcriptional regulator [Rhizocola hellebori]|uniref:XRE family transcriptional regulator n=1 Tax=Rhizocola hellebori TaxID=1392758 RepID=A0A8J3VF40_9ACTN|nr:XRE family transcriptional regulator [Rhizocola hellebori]
MLAYLLLSGNRVVQVDTLIGAVWADEPPSTARNQIQSDISEIRRVLRSNGFADRLDTTSHGYRLAVEPHESDVSQFKAMAAKAKASSDLDDSARVLREALALWRGPALADAAGSFVDATRASLEDERLNAVELLATIELERGHHHEIVAELADHARLHPLRETLIRHFAMALYRSGQPPRALEVLRSLRRGLANEYGIDPSRETEELQKAILRSDTGLEFVQAQLPTRNLLPPAPSHFAGRADQLATLDSLLSNQRLALITGPGGAGKTALALQWAHRSVGNFPDGLFYLDLRGFSRERPLRPIDALSRLLHQLGVPPERIPVKADFAADMFRANVSGKKLLIVLDNVQDAGQVRPLLAAGPSCRTVVTSRTEMAGLVARDGALAIRLGALAPAEAHTLFAVLIGSHQVQSLDELCLLCGYLPLAIRIAAAAMATYPTADAYIARLRSSDRLQALRLPGDEAAEMSATFYLSYKDLPRPARSLFGLVGSLPGPDFSAATASAVAQTDVAQSLDTLTGAHLVERRPGDRYALHDLLKLYAIEQAADNTDVDDTPAVVLRLCTYYLNRAEAAAQTVYPQVLRLPVVGAQAFREMKFDDATTAIGWLDAERANLCATVLAGCVHEAKDVRAAAIRIADCLRGYFFLRMFTVDWQNVADAALAAAQADGDVQAMTAMWLSLADLHLRLGEHEPAEAHYADAVEQAQRADWQIGMATALGNLGALRRLRGDHPTAVELLHRSLSINTDNGRLEGQCVNLGNLALVYQEMGDYAQAERHLLDAHEIFGKVGSLSAQGACLSNLGEVAWLAGDAGRAEHYAHEALAVHRQLGDKASEASTLRILAHAKRMMGQLAEATTLVNAALALAKDSTDERILAYCLLASAEVRCAAGEGGFACLDDAHRGLELARQAKHKYIETKALITIAEVSAALGHRDMATSYAQQAAALASTSGYRHFADIASQIA